MINRRTLPNTLVLRNEIMNRIRDMFHDIGGEVFTDNWEARRNGFTLLQSATNREFVRDELGPRLQEAFGSGNWGVSPWRQRTVDVDVWIRDAVPEENSVEKAGAVALQLVDIREVSDIDKT